VWQDGDRRLVWKGKRRLFGGHSSFQVRPIEPHRSGDVLQLLLADKLKSNSDLALEVVEGGAVSSQQIVAAVESALTEWDSGLKRTKGWRRNE
jgi:hypothetical protein